LAVRLSLPPINGKRRFSGLLRARCGCQIALQQTTERLLDYLVGTAKQWERDREAERIGGLEIDGHLNFRDLPNR
jgi:hypothetical protein